MPLARVNCDPVPELTSTWSAAMRFKPQQTSSTNNHIFEAELPLYNIKKFSFQLTIKMLSPFYALRKIMAVYFVNYTGCSAGECARLRENVPYVNLLATDFFQILAHPVFKM